MSGMINCNGDTNSIGDDSVDSDDEVKLVLRRRTRKGVEEGDSNITNGAFASLQQYLNGCEESDDEVSDGSNQGDEQEGSFTGSVSCSERNKYNDGNYSNSRGREKDQRNGVEKDSTPSYQNEISNFPVDTTVRTGITRRLSHRQNLPSSTAVSASVRSIHNSGSDENKRHNPLSHNYTQSATDSMKKIMRRQQRQLQQAKSASAQKQHQAPQTSIFDDHFESALLRGSSNETDYALSSRVLSCNTPTANRMNASRTSRWYSTPKSASNILHGFENFEPTSLSSCKGGEGKRKRSSTNSKSRLQSPSETFSFGKRSISANSTDLRGRLLDWGSSEKSNLKTTKLKTPNTWARAKQLAAATKSSSILSRTKQKHSRNPKSSSRCSVNASATKHLSFSSTEKDLSFVTTSWPKFDKQQNAKDDLESSFGPSFLNNKKRLHPIAVDKVADEDGNDDDSTGGDHSRRQPREKSSCRDFLKERDPILATPRGMVQTPSTSPKSGDSQGYSFGAYSNSPQYNKHSSRKRKKLKGHFSKMLQTIRGSAEADWVRFNSGTYPYRPASERRYDVNDPRNRADTVMDVTIIGQSTTPLTASSSTTIIVILGYIHSFCRNESKVNTARLPTRKRRFCPVAPLTSEISRNGMNLHSANEDEQKHDCSIGILHCPAFAWLCFSHETVEDLRIGKDMQLRVYNPLAIREGAYPYPVVMCTTLCEIYPTQLPRLCPPNVSLLH